MKGFTLVEDDEMLFNTLKFTDERSLIFGSSNGPFSSSGNSSNDDNAKKPVRSPRFVFETADAAFSLLSKMVACCRDDCITKPCPDVWKDPNLMLVFTDNKSQELQKKLETQLEEE